MSELIYDFDLVELDATFIKSSVDYIWQADGKLYVDMGKAIADSYNHTIKTWGRPNLDEVCDWLEDLNGFIKEELYHIEANATQDYDYILIEDEQIERAVAVRGGNTEDYYGELWSVDVWLNGLHTVIKPEYYPLVASLIADTLRGANPVSVPVT